MVRVGIVGLGYWGPNLVRNFSELPESEVTAVCDIDPGRLQKVSSRFPRALATSDVEELLDRGRIDAVVISTPTRTHYSLAKKALERGIHVFTEKPMATSIAECEELIHLSKKNGTQLFVGHIFLYNAAVLKLKEYVNSGELGNICYIFSSRLNLGPVRTDVNALWDLATHDISIILHLIDSERVSVNCQGLAYLNSKIHDVCTVTIHFQNGCMAILHSSWLDPNKVRQMTVVGDKKMAVYNDIEPLEKIKIYEKGIDKPLYTDNFGEFHFSYRYGDTFSPRIIETESLKAECQHFIHCIQKGIEPRTCGQNGMQVVNVLAGADLSLHDGGGKVLLQSLAGNKQ
ncbi:MAG: Gfo/Idh/MocA family oxidoreductase [Deltaproteobacteria bacterium]|nr:MAG: Gfo/Idh/MocA family oxidoreductase [Deltaproteobacteria bacterium]